MSKGMRFGGVCGMFIYLPPSSISISAGAGGASGFTASIHDHAQRPRQIHGLPDALRTQVQAAAWHGPGRRCRLFYLLNYDPFETPCYSFSIYPLWYINTSPTPILYCLDRCFTWMIGSFMLHQLEFNNFFRMTHICSY